MKPKEEFFTGEFGDVPEEDVQISSFLLGSIKYGLATVEPDGIARLGYGHHTPDCLLRIVHYQPGNDLLQK